MSHLLRERLIKIIYESELTNKNTYIILFSICIIGAFIRFQDITHSLNVDEITTAWVVKDNLIDIFTRCWINNLSPLYYTIVYIFTSWFGLSESALRIPTIIAGVLSIPLIYIITLKLTNLQQFSLFAAFLSAFDRQLISFSQEVRPYALVIFFSLLCICFFLAYLQRNNKRLYACILGFLTGTAILFHYTSAVLCLILVLVAGIYFIFKKQINRDRIIELLLFTSVLLIMLIPFFSHLKYLFDIRDILTSYYRSYSAQLNQFFTIMFPPIKWYILLPFLLSFVFECWKRMENFTRIKINKGLNFYLLVLWYLIPLAFYLLLATLNIAHMVIPRYLALIIPVPIICSMAIVASYRSKWSKFIYIAIVIYMTNVQNQDSVIRNFTWKSYDKHWEWGFYRAKSAYDWKEAVKTVNNLDNIPSKIYVMVYLIEYQMLNSNSQYDNLLKDYLLSAVNSIYKLDDNYLDNAELLNSAQDIPYNESDYLLIGRRSHIQLQDETGFKKLSPVNATVDLYYKN